VPLVTTGELVRAARDAGGAVLAFNVITLEHAEAIAAGADRAGRPAILQISHNAVRFHGALAPIAIAARAVSEGARVDLSLHLDHVEDYDLLRQAADAGFSSAMFDAGARSYDENVTATRSAAEWAHANGLWLEAELGYVGGKPDAPASAHAEGVRTDPAEAVAYVAATGVDGLAVAVGTSHAMTTRTATLDTGLVATLRRAVPVPLVLHGSSGLPDVELRAAIAAGMTKINIGTALNIAFTAGVREALGVSVDPRAYLAPARAATADVVERMLARFAADLR
jgi:fructose-bisphosphate aldolase, class II